LAAAPDVLEDELDEELEDELELLEELDDDEVEFFTAGLVITTGSTGTGLGVDVVFLPPPPPPQAVNAAITPINPHCLIAVTTQLFH
jgi:hypothetical protein